MQEIEEDGGETGAMTSPNDDLKDATLDEMRGELKKKTSFTRPKEKPGHWQQQFELVSADGERQYILFTRKSSTNAGVFSVGLSLVRPDGNLVLCRYNSGHHGHKNILEKVKVPAVPHRHLATARYITAGLDPDGFAEPASGYSSMEEALSKLVQDCNIQGILKPPEPPPSEPPTTPQHPLFK